LVELTDVVLRQAKVGVSLEDEIHRLCITGHLLG